MSVNPFFTFILFASCFIIHNPMYCQEILWQNTIGGDSVDVLYNMKITSDGGVVCAGLSNSNVSGDKNENSEGGYDYWIVKLDASGNVQWQNTIGGSGYDKIMTINLTSDNGYICGGQSSSDISGDKNENCLGLNDYWIVKLDSSGNIQWQNTIGGNDDDWFGSIEQTSDGGFICGGYSLSDSSGDKTSNSYGYFDMWILKLDVSGNIEWQQTIGGVNYDYLTSISQLANGNYISAGNTRFPTYGSTDYWVVMIDSLGSVLWQNHYGGDDFDYLTAIQSTNDNGFILGGYSLSDSSGNKTENSLGSFDFWIIKIDDSGNILWQNTIGGNSLDELFSIEKTSDQGYICGGVSRSTISGDKSENNKGVDDFWLVKLDSLGRIMWQNTIGGNYKDEIRSIQQIPSGGYICGGPSSSDISSDKTEAPIGGGDFWVMKIAGNYNLISGNSFVDYNSNNIKDSNEPWLPNNKITEINTNRFSFTQSDGTFYLSLPDTGNFEVFPATNLNLFTPTPSSQSASFNSFQQIDLLNDFAYQPIGTINDLSISISPIGNFTNGFNASYIVSYSNVGNTVMTPTIIFYPDDSVTFVSSTMTPSLITTDSIVWNLLPLTPFQTTQLFITVNINAGLPLGSTVNSGVKIEPLIGDANPQNNQSFWEVITTGSFDPNDILVSKGKLTDIEVSNGQYLEYLIRFQNTGNDTAFTVKILNPIDTNFLNINSFEFVSSSHTVKINWITWEMNAEFLFENILLPDSIVNEPLSHGFVRYRIQPKSNLMVGDSILNSAAIYFDFNPPVITNTAITEIVLPTSLAEPILSEKNNLIVYPNPSWESIKFTFSDNPNNNIIDEIVISDVLGQTILNVRTGNTTDELDISQLSEGLFFVKIRIGNVFKTGKFLKM